MKKTILVVIAIFMILFTVKLALALDCNRIDDQENCLEILNSDWDLEDQKLGIANLIDDSKEWNSEIDFDQVPEDAVNKGIIKNAWLKILEITPSVYENDTLLSPGKGIVYVEYDYEIEEPSETMKGDCKTLYSVSHDEDFDVYLNGNNIDESFDVNTNMNFYAKLEINAKLKIKHYKKRRTLTGTKCRLSKTETENYNLILEDNLFAKYYNPNINYEFKVIDKYFGTNKIKFNVQEITGYRLEFKDAYYQKEYFGYSNFFSFRPLNVVHLRADNQIKVKSRNVKFHEDYYFVNNLDDCKIVLFTHFENITKDCDLNYRDAGLKVKTDKLSYFEGDKIIVTLKPENTLIEVIYSDSSYLVKNKIELKASTNENRIRAVLHDVENDVNIHVKDKNPWALLFNLSIFAGINIMLIKIIKVKLGGFL
ncbi:hypothetical protein ACFL1H_02185 [Nanoarchaeota archaeon]